MTIAAEESSAKDETDSPNKVPAITIAVFLGGPTLLLVACCSYSARRRRRRRRSGEERRHDDRRRKRTGRRTGATERSESRGYAEHELDERDGERLQTRVADLRQERSVSQQPRRARGEARTYYSVLNSRL